MVSGFHFGTDRHHCLQYDSAPRRCGQCWCDVGPAERILAWIIVASFLIFQRKLGLSPLFCVRHVGFSRKLPSLDRIITQSSWLGGSRREEDLGREEANCGGEGSQLADDRTAPGSSRVPSRLRSSSTSWMPGRARARALGSPIRRIVTGTKPTRTELRRLSCVRVYDCSRGWKLVGPKGAGPGARGPAGPRQLSLEAICQSKARPSRVCDGRHGAEMLTFSGICTLRRKKPGVADGPLGNAGRNGPRNRARPRRAPMR